jgi:hypothetical protein
MWHVCARGEAYTGFWWGNMRESDNLEDLGLNWKVISKWTLKKWAGGRWFDLAPERGRR